MGRKSKRRRGRFAKAGKGAREVYERVQILDNFSYNSTDQQLSLSIPTAPSRNDAAPIPILMNERSLLEFLSFDGLYKLDLTSKARFWQAQCIYWGVPFKSWIFPPFPKLIYHMKNLLRRGPRRVRREVRVRCEQLRNDHDQAATVEQIVAVEQHGGQEVERWITAGRDMQLAVVNAMQYGQHLGAEIRTPGSNMNLSSVTMSNIDRKMETINAELGQLTCAPIAKKEALFKGAPDLLLGISESQVRDADEQALVSKVRRRLLRKLDKIRSTKPARTSIELSQSNSISPSTTAEVALVNTTSISTDDATTTVSVPKARKTKKMSKTGLTIFMPDDDGICVDKDDRVAIIDREDIDELIADTEKCCGEVAGPVTPSSEKQPKLRSRTSRRQFAHAIQHETLGAGRSSSHHTEPGTPRILSKGKQRLDVSNPNTTTAHNVPPNRVDLVDDVDTSGESSDNEWNDMSFMLCESASHTVQSTDSELLNEGSDSDNESKAASASGSAKSIHNLKAAQKMTAYSRRHNIASEKFDNSDPITPTRHATCAIKSTTSNSGAGRTLHNVMDVDDMFIADDHSFKNTVEVRTHSRRQSEKFLKNALISTPDENGASQAMKLGDQVLQVSMISEYEDAKAVKKCGNNTFHAYCATNRKSSHSDANGDQSAQHKIKRNYKHNNPSRQTPVLKSTVPAEHKKKSATTLPRRNTTSVIPLVIEEAPNSPSISTHEPATSRDQTQKASTKTSRSAAGASGTRPASRQMPLDCNRDLVLEVIRALRGADESNHNPFKGKVREKLGSKALKQRLYRLINGPAKPGHYWSHVDTQVAYRNEREPNGRFQKGNRDAPVEAHTTVDLTASDHDAIENNYDPEEEARNIEAWIVSADPRDIKKNIRGRHRHSQRDCQYL